MRGFLLNVIGQTRPYRLTRHALEQSEGSTLNNQNYLHHPNSGYETGVLGV